MYEGIGFVAISYTAEATINSFSGAVRDCTFVLSYSEVLASEWKIEGSCFWSLVLEFDKWMGVQLRSCLFPVLLALHKTAELWKRKPKKFGWWIWRGVSSSEQYCLSEEVLTVVSEPNFLQCWPLFQVTLEIENMFLVISHPFQYLVPYLRFD